MKKIIITILLVLSLVSCGTKKEEWNCVKRDDLQLMYSENSQGNMGGAQKGCSCEEIRDFEMKTFGQVDYDALKSDFGCSF